MGESETVVDQTSAASNYMETGLSNDHDGSVTNAASDVGNDGDLASACPNDTGNSSSSSAVGDLVSSTSTTGTAHASNAEAGNQYNTGPESSQRESTTAMTYDGSQDLAALANGSNIEEARDTATAGLSGNGIASDVHATANLHQAKDGLASSAEEERLWSIVGANSLDFNAWTALVEETEKMSEGNILKIRKVYDAFLAEFPLCYGYWKKYADHEARFGSVDKVLEVYERSVQGVTYSVDMWLHFCVFAISTYGDPDTVRRLFERGLAYVGADYLSFPLWDKYLEYEYTQQAWSNVATIYTQILQNPNQQLDRYFEGFKELVASRPLSELRTAEEAAAADASDMEAGGEQIDGEVHPSVDSSKPVNASLKGAEELVKYIAVREEMYRNAKEFDSKIIGFETAIRRPYFHVRPLNVAELENWHNYLDFIEGGDDFNKVVKLYERCLIACASYPEYWIRYVSSMQARGSMDLADNALARATQVFVKRQPEIQLFAARFREQHGDIPGARAAYQLVHDEIAPGLLEAIIKHANMEHRLGKHEDACSLYEQAIAIEKGKEHSQSLPLLFAQYSRFLYLVSGKVEKAREILDQAIENGQLSKPLLEALIHFESLQLLPKRINLLDSLVDKFILPSPENPNVASIDEREELSCIFLEFLDLFGDAPSIKKADSRHAKLFLRHKTTSESKKRHAEDYLGSEKTKLAKSAVVSSTPAVMGAYPGAQNQWPAAYGVQAQTWPQATQGQAQQWNPGHAQQAAYGPYNGYGGNYSHPQAPTSAPSSTGYGAYPPSTYPAQAYPQQNYAQPTAAVAAAALAPAQATAVPPASYYGSYY